MRIGLCLRITYNELSLKIIKVNDVNGIEIAYPDLYYNECLMVHGFRSVIPLLDEMMKWVRILGKLESNNAVKFDVYMGCYPGQKSYINPAYYYSMS